MGRKLLSFLMAFVLLLSCATTALAAESEVLSEPHSHSEAAHTEIPSSEPDSSIVSENEETISDSETTKPDTLLAEPENSTVPEDSEIETPLPDSTKAEPPQPETLPVEPENSTIPEDVETEISLPDSTETGSLQPEIPPAEQETPEYFLLETRSGESIVMFGTPEEPSEPIFTPFLVGSRPCAFLDCPNTVTVRTKYDFVCDSHKCSISGCSNPAYYTNPNKCQLHAGRTDTICQIYVPGNPDNLCGKPSVSSGSICCWEHHCPGCLGIGNGNATLCDICKQCWVPGCTNFSTCTNECDEHCPHNCKTHHQNHCLDCHSDPCICFPDNPTINMRTWNSTDNSIAVDISSARATEIELYTAGGVKFATLGGTSGTYIFRYNSAQNYGRYYVRVKSVKGYNSGSFPFQVSGLDLAPPGITGKAVQPANEVWAIAKTLSVTATDQTNAYFSLRYADGSTVPGCPDKEGNSNGSGYTASWTITEQITNAKTFRITATDRWGYTSETTVTVSGIDNKKPSKPSVFLSDSGEWQNKDVTVTISGGSADSGISHYLYRINSGVWQTGNTVRLTDEGIHMVEAKAVSRSGLESDIVSETVRIDKTKPTASYTLSPEDWTAEPVTITLTPADSGGSGLASVILPDGKTVKEFTNIQFPVTQNSDYRFIITDNAGNSTTLLVTVSNIAILDVTVTLNAPFVISPDSDRLYAGDISFQNHSNVPVSLTLQRVTAYGNAPELMGKDDKAWKSLSVTDTRKYLALGFTGNGVNFWIDAQSKNSPHSLGTIAKGGSASYSMQGRFGYAWEQTESFLYGITVKVEIAR